MPRGGARTGSGRRRKPVMEHVRLGSYRRDRHGPLPSDPDDGSGGTPPDRPEASFKRTSRASGRSGGFSIAMRSNAVARAAVGTP
jgi:hypothetical protein